MAKPVDLLRHPEVLPELPRSATLADAEALVEQGDLEAAAPQVEALLATDPGEAAAWFLRARLLAARGEATDALVACGRAIALWPDILPVCRLLLDLAGGADDAGDLTDIAALQQGKAADEFDQTILTAVDELVKQTEISDATWAALSEKFDTKQLMDFLFTIGGYHMLAMALNTFGVEPAASTSTKEN